MFLRLVSKKFEKDTKVFVMRSKVSKTADMTSSEILLRVFLGFKKYHDGKLMHGCCLMSLFVCSEKVLIKKYQLHFCKSHIVEYKNRFNFIDKTSGLETV